MAKELTYALPPAARKVHLGLHLDADPDLAPPLLNPRNHAAAVSDLPVAVELREHCFPLREVLGRRGVGRVQRRKARVALRLEREVRCRLLLARVSSDSMEVSPRNDPVE